MLMTVVQQVGTEIVTCRVQSNTINSMNFREQKNEENQRVVQIDKEEKRRGSNFCYYELCNYVTKRSR